jgi:hypothetical protein
MFNLQDSRAKNRKMFNMQKIFSCDLRVSKQGITSMLSNVTKAKNTQFLPPLPVKLLRQES